jgi:hypothetical protein
VGKAGDGCVAGSVEVLVEVSVGVGFTTLSRVQWRPQEWRRRWGTDGAGRCARAGALRAARAEHSCSSFAACR